MLVVAIAWADAITIAQKGCARSTWPRSVPSGWSGSVTTTRPAPSSGKSSRSRVVSHGRDGVLLDPLTRARSQMRTARARSFRAVQEHLSRRPGWRSRGPARDSRQGAGDGRRRRRPLWVVPAGRALSRAPVPIWRSHATARPGAPLTPAMICGIPVPPGGLTQAGEPRPVPRRHLPIDLRRHRVLGSESLRSWPPRTTRHHRRCGVRSRSRSRTSRRSANPQPSRHSRRIVSRARCRMMTRERRPGATKGQPRS